MERKDLFKVGEHVSLELRGWHDWSTCWHRSSKVHVKDVNDKGNTHHADKESQPSSRSKQLTKRIGTAPIHKSRRRCGVFDIQRP